MSCSIRSRSPDPCHWCRGLSASVGGCNGEQPRSPSALRTALSGGAGVLVRCLIFASKLSQQEGLEQVYQLPMGFVAELDGQATIMSTVVSLDLTADGYRLPTGPVGVRP